MGDGVSKNAIEQLHDARDRIEMLEAFVREVENIETEWVTGAASAQESMVSLSKAWHAARYNLR